MGRWLISAFTSSAGHIPQVSAPHDRFNAVKTIGFRYAAAKWDNQELLRQRQVSSNDVCVIYDLLMMVSAPKLTLLLADGDVIIRVALGDYLRSCGFIVLEAADCAEAKAVLQSSDLTIAVLICDAQLAGGENGFAVAQWVRRCHPAIEVLLTTTLANKARIAASFCGRHDVGRGMFDAIGLASRIRAMAARKRRAPPADSGAAWRRRTTT